MSLAGYYTQTLILLTHDLATDPFDTGGDSWTTGKAIKAAVNQMDGQKRFVSGTHQVLGDYKVLCAVDADITTDKRIRWNSEDYEIVEQPKNTLMRDHHYLFRMRRVDD